MQTGGLGKGAGNDYGVVSDGHGFEDSPDCERIAGGINSKGPYAVAIGREANVLQWGFYAAPDRMTDSAKRAFLNAIVYMDRFDGAAPLVEKRARSRSWMDQTVGTLRKLGRDEQSDSLWGYYLGQFPDEVVRRTHGDPEKLAAWLDDVREYLRMGENRRFVVDPDLRELGISNRQPAFLEWLADTLGGDPEDARALGLAARYLGEHGRDSATALAWIRANRGRLFFSDVGGFQWFADTREAMR